MEKAGSVHPIAFLVSDDAAHVRVRQALIEKGVQGYRNQRKVLLLVHLFSYRGRQII